MRLGQLGSVSSLREKGEQLPGFRVRWRKLRALEAAGQIGAVCVGVRSTEGPEAIEREADLVVDGPAGVAELLEALAGP